MSVGMILVIALMIATVGVLLAGITLMVIGGPLNEKYGNRLMTWRVTLQGAAILVLGLMFLSASS